MNKHDPTTKVVANLNSKSCVYASINTDLQRGYFNTFRECVAKCFRNLFYAYLMMIIAHSYDDSGENKPEIQRKVQACNSDNPYQVATTGNHDNDNSVVRYYYKKSENKCKRFETAPNSDGSQFNVDKNSFPTLDLCHSYCGTGK